MPEDSEVSQVSIKGAKETNLLNGAAAAQFAEERKSAAMEAAIQEAEDK